MKASLVCAILRAEVGRECTRIPNLVEGIFLNERIVGASLVGSSSDHTQTAPYVFGFGWLVSNMSLRLHFSRG